MNPTSFDPVVYGSSCGCGAASSLFVCGQFSAPLNPDLGRCWPTHLFLDGSAPVVSVNNGPAETLWNSDGTPLFIQL
jgi:hypothetical protein